MASSTEYIDGVDLDAILCLLEEDELTNDSNFQSDVDSLLSEVGYLFLHFIFRPFFQLCCFHGTQTKVRLNHLCAFLWDI